MTPPTRYALVPAIVDEAMDNSFYEAHAKAATFFAGFQDCWTAALAASPNAGKITAEMLERAAAAAYERGITAKWAKAGRKTRALWSADMRAALTALGLQVDAPAGCKQEVVDG